MFGKRNFSIFAFITKNMIDMSATKTNELQIVRAPEARMLYIDFHECPAHGENLDKYISDMKSVLDDAFEWVVVDIRNNLGGSLLPLYVLTEYLFDRSTADFFSRC